MRVSSLSRQPQQAQLFEDVLPMAACRNWCGDFFEEATATLLGGRRIRTDASCDICPDIVVERVVEYEYRLGCLPMPVKAERKYVEAKSLGTNGEALVYEERLKKDRRFVDAGHDLTVAMWHHTLAVGMGGGMTLSELRAALACSTASLTLVPFADYERIMLGQPLRRFSHRAPGSKKRGYGAFGYEFGRRCRLKVFDREATYRAPFSDLRVYENGLLPVEIRSVRPFTIFLDECAVPRIVL